MFAPSKKKKLFPPPPPPTKTCSELSLNKVLKGTSKAVSAPTSYLLLLPHCFNFLACLPQPLSHLTEELVNPLALSTDLSSVTPAVSEAVKPENWAPGFPSYSMSSHRGWSHLPCFIAKQQVLTLAWAFIHYAFAKTHTTTVGHSAATRQKAANTRVDDVCHHRTEPSHPSAEKKPGKFQNVNWSRLPHIAFTKSWTFSGR